MKRPVSGKNRLGSVVKLRQQEEDRALSELASAQRRNASAAEALESAQDLTRLDERRRGSAIEWQIADSAHVTALREMREAERAASAAIEHLERSHAQFITAHGRVEAVRRVAELRAEGAAREASETEQKQQDELAILRHGRKAR
jgi:flagellar export protein FliJ